MIVDAIAPTRVVLLTPAGRSAVATVLVEGPQALASVAALFHPATSRALGERPCGRIVFGRWHSSEHGEEVVVCRRGDEHFEIHCHGGRAAAGAILASLVERGCQETSWQLWARMSLPDPIAAAARVALADAPTERTATILWDQYTGALARALREIDGLLRGQDAQAVLSRIDELLRWSGLGAHLVRPWRVVLVGPPNVGKSSLTNALLGYQRAIVHDQPGTTRDVVATTCALEGWPVELADTAGQRASDEPLEAAGIRLAHDRSLAADLVVLVLDASNPLPPDQSLSASWPLALRVLNKCDLLTESPVSNPAKPCLYTSARLGTGIDALAHEIASRLIPDAPPPGQAVPFAPHHVGQLGLMRSAVLAGDLDRASRDLATLLAAPPDR